MANTAIALHFKISLSYLTKLNKLVENSDLLKFNCTIDFPIYAYLNSPRNLFPFLFLQYTGPLSWAQKPPH